VLDDALALIASVPGYEGVARSLRDKQTGGKLRLEAIEDRGSASVLGVIRIGPEVLADGPVALAATLVHEHFHTTQFPLVKTVSFWVGAFTGTHVWQRLERPAYQAAVEFLETLALARPDLAAECGREIEATRASFQAFYNAALMARRSGTQALWGASPPKTALVNRTIDRSRAGSSQTDVPVKPVCPNEDSESVARIE
jgi:hypothetical protein